MRRFVLVIAFLICAARARGETRGILLEVTSLREVGSGLLEYASPAVNVYSQEANERKQNVSLSEAAQILKQTRGSHSQVLVYIVFHRDFIKPDDLITLLEGMKNNPALMLFYVGPADHGTGKQELDTFRKSGDPKT